MTGSVACFRQKAHCNRMKIKTMFTSKYMKRILNRIRPVVLAGIVFFAACQPIGVLTEKPPFFSNIHKIMVLPFKNMAAVYGENVNVRCPVCGNVFMTSVVSGDAQNILTDSLFSILKNYENTEIVPPVKAQAALIDQLRNTGERLSERKLIEETGRTFGVDAAIFGYVYRFKERVGSRYSIESPASVAFGLHLINVKTGRTLWLGHFNETQQSLSENVFKLRTFFQRKGSWITAREMATSGLEDLFRTIPMQ